MAISILDDLAECLGSQAKVARVCNVKPPSLHGWVRVPARHVLKLEAAVRAEGGTIDRYSMRPDIYGQSPESTEQASVA
ncbi:transcriptional regulator [Marinobacter oulmenensis]|uniref:DNA-binding transcriptional regulator YdaS (Cro superfamily) n=1 Tax=Marinobacter oulmenensis TaxID=643747 RepID=A0A840U7S5_9GAMM|nr:DNA-binding transcriptional regulator YdaS (Cro superfamily) [Marinobacter oulmenensis]